MVGGLELKDDPSGSLAPSVPAEATGWVDSTFGSLKAPGYRLLVLIGLGMHMGFFIMVTAQGLAAFELTGNNRSVGFVQFGQGLSMLILTPVGGAVADRVSKRLLFIITMSMMFGSVVTITVLTLTDHLSIFALAANSFVVGMSGAFFVPARTAYIGDLVGPSQHGNAIAVTQIAMNAARIFGPFVGAALLSISALRYGGIFIIVSCFYGVIVLMTLWLPRPVASSGPRRAGMLKEMVLGFRHVRENPRLFALLVGFTVILVAAQPYMVLLPAFTTDVLETSDAGFGIVIGVAAIGGLAVSLVVAAFADSRRADLLLHVSVFGFAASLIAVAVTPSFAILLVTMLLVGGFSSAFQVLSSAVALRESSAEYYGRLQSLMMIGYSLTGIVALPLGALADEIGERAVFAIMGGAGGSMGLLLILWLRLAKRKMALV